MPQLATPWPHAPAYQITSAGVYIVTAATYKKAHLFRKVDLLDVLHHELLSVIHEFGWILEAWAAYPDCFISFTAALRFLLINATTPLVAESGITSGTQTCPTKFLSGSVELRSSKSGKPWIGRGR